jgi:hypothetical protein
MAVHFFYHDDLDDLLEWLILPLLRDCADASTADRMCFTRYVVGGPHIRLRLRVMHESDTGLVRDLVKTHSQSFFHEHKSCRILTQDEIIRITRNALAGDHPAAPLEDSAPRPNNTAHEFPACFESARYGGEAYLPHSLDLFCIVSLAITTEVHSLRVRNALTYSRRARLFLQLALGMLHGGLNSPRRIAEVLARYEAIVPRAIEHSLRKAQNSMHAAGSSVFGRLWLTPKECESSLVQVANGTALLRRCMGQPSLNEEILLSHIHMAANRLGLNTADEIYLLTLLYRTLDITSAAPLLSSFAEPISGPNDSGVALAELARQAFQACGAGKDGLQ